jgi:predicted RNase H-like nuclease (RuvC/YqgF family)
MEVIVMTVLALTAIAFGLCFLVAGIGRIAYKVGEENGFSRGHSEGRASVMREFGSRDGYWQTVRKEAIAMGETWEKLARSAMELSRKLAPRLAKARERNRRYHDRVSNLEHELDALRLAYESADERSRRLSTKLQLTRDALSLDLGDGVDVVDGARACREERDRLRLQAETV